MPHILSKGAPASRRRLSGLFAATGAFLRDNRRLMLFVCLFVGGTVMGLMLFLGAYRSWNAPLRQMLTPAGVGAGLSGAARAVLSSCFSPGVLLLLLFLAGLCVYGLPVTLLTPFFYGLGLGVSEAYYYAAGYGIPYVCALVLPHSLVAVAALLVASMEAARFSLLLSGQLLPKSARLGGLWPEFKLYLARFTLCAGVIFASGIVDVGLRLLLQGFFT